MVHPKCSPKNPNLMCIWYCDDEVSVDVLRQTKISLGNSFSYSCIIRDKCDLMAYLAKEPVTEYIVFIVSCKNKDESEAIKKLVKRRKKLTVKDLKTLDDKKLLQSSDLVFIRDKLKEVFDKNYSTTQHPSETAEDRTNNTENRPEELAAIFDTFRSISNQKTFCDLNNESLKFLLFQALFEVLVNMSYEKSHFKYMWNLLNSDYFDDPKRASDLTKVKKNYDNDGPIHSYTRSSCFFQTINKMFRLEDVDRIFHCGCYIADLCEKLKQLGDSQKRSGNLPTKTYYRGKKYSNSVIQQFRDSVEHLISINGLLSTTKCYEVALAHSGLGEHKEGYQTVIFEINVNHQTENSIRPCAEVEKHSAHPYEAEVLFFMGFVWKLKSMDPIGPGSWYVVLESCSDYDSELTKYIEDSRHDCTYKKIAEILRELGDYPNAKNFYERMLEDKKLTEEMRGSIYFRMGEIAEEQDEYVVAKKYFTEAEKLIQPSPALMQNSNTLPGSKALFAHANLTSRLHIFNNLSRLYLKDGKIPLAKEYLRKALAEEGSDVDRAIVFNNFGLLEWRCQHLEQARVYFNNAISLAQNDGSVTEYTQNLEKLRKHIAESENSTND